MMDIPADRLRIIDANINRLGEGLRVLEEFARLTLNNTVLTQQLKDLRHRLVNIGGDLQKQLLQSRAADADVGSKMDSAGEDKSRDAAAIIIANARRAQESLRVMEEIAKMPGLGLDSEAYRKSRFELYTIEKTLLSGMLRREKTRKITGLYAVIDTEWLRGRDPGRLTEEVIRGGAKTVQLRCKERVVREFLAIAKDLKKICRDKDALFIINDSLGVALAVGADGLHIGQEDLPAGITRKLIPIDMILGVSVRTKAEAAQALADGADYLGVGAVYATATKESAKEIGLDGLREIKQSIDLPLVAIGGINKDNLKEVIEAGADSAAVISAVLGAEDVARAAAQLVNIFRECSRG
ncbi:MAG: thiamine phosphate synthase [Dehalococcoidales bacterium]|jgi:thiamine-phosphate pyrophosphorylase